MNKEKTDYNYSYDERFNPAFWTIRQNREETEPEPEQSGEAPAESEENEQ